VLAPRAAIALDAREACDSAAFSGRVQTRDGLNVMADESVSVVALRKIRARKAAEERETTPVGAAIRIVKGEIARMVDEAESALIAAADTAPIMVRAGLLVQPVVDRLVAAHGRTTEVTLLKALGAANLIYLLNKHAATFEHYDGRSKKWVLVDPPPAVATQLLKKDRWQFPKVAGVITTPTLRPDGTILDRPGYDPATQLWYAPDSQLVLPQLSATPTREEAEQALALLKSLLVNFPFVADVDRSVGLAAQLTTVLRGAFGVAPMTLLRAPDVGTGKSFLIDLISTLARGQPCPVITNTISVEEMEKRLGALVLEGVPLISLDNCSNNIGGDLLCQITERRLIRIRILGKSEAPECEWRGVLFATGNNITLLGDMTRRGLIANLDARIERPELRTFDFDPIERVLTDRGAYIAAAITIARGYITAGKPNVCGSLGSYGEWSSFVRSPLIWLGEEDPVQSMEQAREEDPARRALHNLIDIWCMLFPIGVSYTAAQLIARATECIVQGKSDATGKLIRPDVMITELRELLLQQAGTARGDIDARKVGMWLMSIRGRIHKGYFIERVKEDNARGNRYALKQVS
jgi:putative DNA primase/helicase